MNRAFPVKTRTTKFCSAVFNIGLQVKCISPTGYRDLTIFPVNLLLHGWDADFGRRCKHRYDQTTNIWCQAVYWNALESLNLNQVVTKATRTTKSSQTLVDDVITNLPKRVTHTDIFPRTLVNDHDASLSRGTQFSRASLNGALTQHKNKDKTRQLIMLQRQHVLQALLFKMAL